MSRSVGTAALAEAADEGELVRLLRAGDDDAFELLVREHGARLLAVARRLLGRAEDAADAVQDAFLSVHRSMRTFAGKSRLGTWLHRIVVNAALMQLRRRRGAAAVSIESLLPELAVDRLPAREAATVPETRELVRRCIDRLPTTFRTVLVLRDIEELDTEETARVLGTHKGVVKVRLHRARMALRDLIEREGA